MQTLSVQICHFLTQSKVQHLQSVFQTMAEIVFSAARNRLFVLIVAIQHFYSTSSLMLRLSSPWVCCSVICYTGSRPSNLTKSHTRKTSKGKEKFSLLYETLRYCTLAKNCRSLTTILSKVNSACILDTKSLRTLLILSHCVPLTKFQFLRPQFFTLYVSEFYNTLVFPPSSLNLSWPIFHYFTVHFVSLSFIYTNVCTCF